MIAYIKGKVIDEFDGGVVLENNKVQQFSRTLYVRVGSTALLSLLIGHDHTNRVAIPRKANSVESFTLSVHNPAIV